MTLQPTGIPTVTITLPIEWTAIDRDTNINGSISMVNGTGDNLSNFSGAALLNQNCRIKGRGNSTWTDWAKKPFNVTTSTSTYSKQNTTPFNLPSGSGWSMLALGCYDRSYIRTQVCVRILETLGTAWSSSFQIIWLQFATPSGTVDMGLYLWCEKVEQARVPWAYTAERQENAKFSSSELTFTDNRFNLTDTGHKYGLKVPDSVNQTAIDFMKARIDEFYDSLYTVPLTDLELGYRSKIDIDEAAKIVAFYAFVKDPDAWQNSYYTSYDTVTSKIKFGPAWDHDTKLGTFETSWFHGPHNYRIANNDIIGQQVPVFGKMLEDPYFLGKVKEAWQAGATELENLWESIPAYIDSISSAVALDRQIWNNTTNFNDEVEIVNTYVNERSNYFTNSLYTMAINILSGQVNHMRAKSVLPGADTDGSVPFGTVFSSSEFYSAQEYNPNLKTNKPLVRQFQKILPGVVYLFTVPLSIDKTQYFIPPFETATAVSCNTFFIITQPSDRTVTAGTTTTFTASAAGGTLPVTYQWERSDNGGSTWTNITNATTTTYTTNSLLTSDSGARFRLKATDGTNTTITSTSAILTVNSAETFTIFQDPEDFSAQEGDDATFSGLAQTSNGSGITYQWQRNISGTWTDISGATSTQLDLTAVTLADNGAQFRFNAFNNSNTITSNPATLTVTAIPVTYSAKIGYIPNGIDPYIGAGSFDTSTAIWFDEQTGITDPNTAITLSNSVTNFGNIAENYLLYEMSVGMTTRGRVTNGSSSLIPDAEFVNNRKMVSSTKVTGVSSNPWALSTTDPITFTVS